MSGPLQLTLGVIKPSVCTYQPHVQQVLTAIRASGLEIVRTKRIFWKREEAEKFYGEHAARFFFPRLVEHALSGPFMALALAGPDAIARWRSLIGPTRVYQSQWDAEYDATLRSRFGLSDTRNGFHGSDSPQSAKDELAQVFEDWDTDWWLQQTHR